MKKLVILSAAIVLFSSHDMFLKLGTYFHQPNTPATIKLFNGTFDKSENVIARSRMKDVSLVGNGVRSNPDTSDWTEIDSTITVLNFNTGEAGTWVAGLSTYPKNIELTGDEFNEYLEHDGVLDMLEWRRQNNALGEKAVEKYSKHVKAIFQVGDKKTDDWKTVLDYPIEFVPESNPYDLKPGGSLKVKLLWNGQPLPNQLVYTGSDGAGHEHSHETGSEEEHHHDATQLRTEANGIVTLKDVTEGQWYLRTIHMELSKEEGLTHESNWATLTFEVGHGHSHDNGNHTHSHGIPSWAYWLGGLVVVAGLFFWVKRKK